MTSITKKLFVQAAGKRYPVDSLEDASAKYSALIKHHEETTGTGVSGLTKAASNPLIVDSTGKEIGHISYNGKVWSPDDKLMYDPYRKGKPLWDLVVGCLSKGIDVQFVPSEKLHDFAAMNWETARIFGIEGFPDDTVWVDEHYKADGETLDETQYRNIKHELDEAVEIQRQKREGKKPSYWKAHGKSLKKERDRKVIMPKVGGLRK